MSAAADWLRQPQVQLALAFWCGGGLAVGVLVGWWRNQPSVPALPGPEPGQEPHVRAPGKEWEETLVKLATQRYANPKT